MNGVGSCPYDICSIIGKIHFYSLVVQYPFRDREVFGSNPSETQWYYIDDTLRDTPYKKSLRKENNANAYAWCRFTPDYAEDLSVPILKRG